MFKKTLSLYMLMFALHIYGNEASNLQGEHLFVHNLSTYVSLTPTLLSQMYALACPRTQDSKFRSKAVQRPLFDTFVNLRNVIAHVQLAELPTPIQSMQNLADCMGFDHLYIKRDDLTGKKLEDGSTLFGGNKIRKLEFLLADALLNGAQSVMTWGMSGSNHAVATAACADYLGLKCFVMLRPQHNSHTVRRNLALMDYYGAQMHMIPNKETRALASAYTFLKEKSDNGSYPYFIPTGGSCPIGALGYVNAAFELKEQIKKGIMPEPDRIYVASGSFGTIADLLLGAQLAGLKSKIIGIGVEPEEFKGEFKQAIIKLYNETSQLLHDIDSSIPLKTITDADVQILTEFGGTDYGLFTQDAVHVARLLKEKEEIMLDGTYTAKAMAGMIADIKAHAEPTDVILFWNTFYSDPCIHIVENTDISQLPVSVQKFFNEPVQALDEKE